MNDQDHTRIDEETQPVEAVQHSTARRVVTVGLVLIAAALLGYVLYTFLVAPSISDELIPVQTAEVMIEPSEPSELSAEERRVILNAMQDSEVEITAEEEVERRAVLNAMDSAYSDEVSVEERNAIMQAMP